MAKIELSVLGRQCLSRRFPDFAALETEVAAWENARNAQRATIHWQFTAHDATRKLHRLYPSIISVAEYEVGAHANVAYSGPVHH